MPDYIIRFKTEADLKAAKELLANTKEITAATKATAPAMEQAAEGTKKLTKEKDILKDSTRALGRQIPILHEALVLFKNPIVAVASAVGILISAFQRWLATIDQLEASLTVHEKVTRVIAAMGPAGARAARGVAAFQQRLHDAADDSQKLGDKLARVLELQKQMETRQAEERSAAEGMAMARINESEAAGKLTPAQAIQARANTREHYAKLEEDAKLKSMTDAQDARRDTLRSTMERRVKAEGRLPGALTTAATSEREAVGAQAKEKSDFFAIDEELKANAEEIRLQRSHASGSSGNFWKDILEEGVAGIRGKAFQKRLDQRKAAAPANIERLTARREELERQKVVIQNRTKAATGQAESDRKKATGLEGFIEGSRNGEGELFEGIGAGELEIENFKAHRAKVGPMERQTRNIGVGIDVERAEEEQRQRHRRAMDEEVRRERKSFRGADASPSGGGDAGAAQIAQAGSDVVAATVAAFAEITRTMQDQGQMLGKTRQQLYYLHNSGA